MPFSSAGFMVGFVGLTYIITFGAAAVHPIMTVVLDALSKATFNLVYYYYHYYN